MWKMQTPSPAGDNTLCGKCLNSLALLKILIPENNKIVMTQSSPHKIQMKRPYLKIWLYRYINPPEWLQQTLVTNWSHIGQ